MSETFELRFPPQPELLATARVFAASIGRGAGCSEETLDDLRLGVSEACTEAILGRGDDPVGLSLTLEDGSLTVRVLGPGPEPPRREDDVDLLPALFPDANAVTEPDGRRSVSFSIPIA